MTSTPQTPETRQSLLARVGKTDPEAWREFVEIYQPVIYRTARYMGLQDADAQDVTQQVLLSVAKALHERSHDPRLARFRTWLSTVTRNAALNAIRLRRPDRGTGDSAMQQQLNELREGSTDKQILEREYHKELFRVAANRIEAEFAPDTWQAFWRTTVQHEPIDAVAHSLGKQAGSIYAARSRVIKRLREVVKQLQTEQSQ